MSWAALSGTDTSLAESVFETARFDASVSRLVVGQRSERGNAATEMVTSALETSADDLIICRWPGDRIELAAAAAQSSRVILPADVLGYWEISTRALQQTEPAGLTPWFRSSCCESCLDACFSGLGDWSHGSRKATTATAASGVWVDSRHWSLR